MHAFILAGGFATRLWPLTEKRAKPLLPLAGKPMLTHIVEKLPKDMPVTVSTNAAFAEGFEAWKAQQDRSIDIIIERTTKDDEKLGALGAVAQWVTSEKIEDDVLLLTGDNYFGFSFDAFLQAYQPGTPILAAYDIGEKEKAKSFGTVILDRDRKLANQQQANQLTNKRASDRILAFEEKPKDPKSTLVSTGCSILPKQTLPILKEYAAKHPDNVGGIFEEFLKQKIAVQCFTFTEPWFDIGSFESYLEATKGLVGESILVGEGAELHDTVCEGTVVIGKGSKVTASKLSDTVIFDNCQLNDCVLERCVIDNNCELGQVDLTGKMLREGTKLEL